MTATAHEIAERLGLRKSYGGGWRGACPACGYPTTFSLRQQDGRPLWWCASCGDKDAITAAVRAALGQDWTPPATPVPEKRQDAPSATRKRAWAMQLWDEARPIGGTPAEAYLAARGVLDAWRAFPMPEWGEQLRFHPRTAHPAVPDRLPALLALVRRATDGEPLAVHRTYLRPDGGGKAAVEPQKATLAAVAGGVVMLHQPATDAALGIAEGIETALAASCLMQRPAWAAVAAGNMAQLELPPPPAARAVLVAADNDAPGQTAAWTAAQRWRAEGRKVRVATPDNQGDDFADILARRRAQETMDAR
ncbi:DUF7146 domain-containing protein [Roseomonas sp. USHLN139]|uniref:DUF7146 domain-containing protein n=1 Tax=Roseomonas sp. USHLN139 TaxID=3081298 RepID=UPI003B0275F7